MARFEVKDAIGNVVNVILLDEADVDAFAPLLPNGHALSLVYDPVAALAAAESKRSALLAETDWYVIRAIETPVKPVPQNVKDYRQALRDLDTQPGWPDNVTWPAKPV